VCIWLTVFFPFLGQFLTKLRLFFPGRSLDFFMNVVDKSVEERKTAADDEEVSANMLCFIWCGFLPHLIVWLKLLRYHTAIIDIKLQPQSGAAPLQSLCIYAFYVSTIPVNYAATLPRVFQNYQQTLSLAITISQFYVKLSGVLQHPSDLNIIALCLLISFMQQCNYSSRHPGQKQWNAPSQIFPGGLMGARK